MSYLKLFKASAAALAIFALSFSASLAQTKAQNQQGQVQAPGAPSPQKVSGSEISTLIRTTLVALHQANLTGNYTVLRDLGAMSFQRFNTAVRLGQVFTRIRRAGLDLSPAVLMDAVLTKKPVIDGNGLLHLEGRVPSRPLNIVFKMAFRFEGGRWRIFSLAVGARQPEAIALDKKPDTTVQKKAPPAAKADTAKSSKTTTQP
jgi:hypothetical protein